MKSGVDIGKLLMPDAQFWRPFDGLLGAIDGLLPADFFPILNRVLVVLAHVANGFLIERILDVYKVQKNIAILSSLLFLLSSAAVATWVSPDGVAQAYSVLFGLIACYQAMKNSGYWYLLPLFLSLFWKESGISWFIVVMLFQLSETKQWKVKRVGSIILVPLIAIAFYFGARFLLQGGVFLGNPDIDRYNLSLFSLSTVTNFFKLTGLSFSGIDTIALFSSKRNLILVGITGILSVPFVLTMVIGVIVILRRKVKEEVLQLIFLMMTILLLTGPLILMESVGEMHAYPVLAGVAILVGFILDRSGLAKNIAAKLTIALLFVAFGISSVHKLVTIYQYSIATETLTKKIYEAYQESKDSMLLVANNEPDDYSVFIQPAIAGTAGVASLQRYFGWGDVPLKIEYTDSEEESQNVIGEMIDKYDYVYMIKGTGLYLQ